MVVELINYSVANLKFKKIPFFYGCEVIVDVGAFNINIDFKYDD
ncbi:Uncharacterised protein [Yersinia pseudotuberculosis]|uniref:Uncharacterized protein n=1 Tax=Yersinia pseudotuberculosis serotype O:1b (strain IP 31758) TaxID=349747 RepID=A0A0U1QX82_YERP3|nr:hypothetical protein YpsIP31758_0516 [Yersinia pseudotuberculosis IP 31758]AJK14512.1 hypothetical protein BZ19_2912 [Yersinia pseudotuberculosis str. PA3606]UFA60157.1 Uncharacterized protein YP598_0529 [Yersinia pseudotuberculosis]CNI73717.1 Uncharacterised protein [Yersinia pseudotuberculosis]